MTRLLARIRAAVATRHTRRARPAAELAHYDRWLKRLAPDTHPSTPRRNGY